MAGERSFNLAFKSFRLMKTNPQGQDLQATGIWRRKKKQLRKNT